MSYSGVEYQCEICHHIYVTDIDIGITKCPNCGKQNDVTSENSKPVTEKPETDGTNGDSVEISSEKYPALRTIASFYKFLAYGVGVIAIIVIGSLVFLHLDSTTDYYDPSTIVILMLGSVVVGSITFITLLTMSEGIMLFVNMANDLSEVKMSLDDQ